MVRNSFKKNIIIRENLRNLRNPREIKTTFHYKYQNNLSMQITTIFQ